MSRHAPLSLTGTSGVTAEKPAASATKLTAKWIEKPWGRTDLPPIFPSPGDRKIGEIWFETPTGEDLPLLVKYLFSSDRLSIQVHPDDEAAQASGFARGKNECWFVIEADADATIGLGLAKAMSKEALRAAASDGSIEQLLDWQRVSSGDFIYVPAGTIHAVRGHFALLEVGQNADATYRLYDYGRPRNLHVEEAMRVARAGPAPVLVNRAEGRSDFSVLVSARPFSVVHVASATESLPSLDQRWRWVMPISGRVRSEETCAVAGECLLLAPGVPFAVDVGSAALVAVEGPL